MDYQSMICEVCGGTNFVEKDGKLLCLHCDTTYEKVSETESEEEKVAREAFNSAEQKLDCFPPRFDDAEDEFCDLIKKYPTWSVGYWGLVRAKYGIKYETDFDGKLIPSCYKSEYRDFREDSNFKKAVQYAESDERREKYISEGDRIADTCREWTSEARKYSYDIFISFKASDDHGHETRDCYEMQNLYTFLTEKGYKVFFSPVSMRLYTGQNYDAYIFNALDKAKVMIVYGSNYEYFSTTWVQNEWTRYLRMISRGHKQSGSLIVAYDRFNPSELPRQLRSLQAVNAADKTFYITLSETIKKIIDRTEEKTDHQKTDESVLEVFKSNEPHKHTYNTEIISSTCIAKGYTLHKCNCGDEYKDQYTPLTDHQYVKKEEIPAACVTGGKIKYSCRICGELKEETLPPRGHRFSDWYESLPATCTADGEMSRKCAACGFTEKRSSPRKGHTFGAWYTSKAASCLEDGQQIRKCITCGHTETKTISKTGHTFGEWTVSGSGKSKAKTRTCTKCGYTESVPIAESSDINTRASENFKLVWKKLNIWLFLSLACFAIGVAFSNDTRVLVEGIPLFQFMAIVGGILTFVFEISRVRCISKVKSVYKHILSSCKRKEGFAAVISFVVCVIFLVNSESYIGTELYDILEVLGSFAFIHMVFAIVCASVANSRAKKVPIAPKSNVQTITANNQTVYIETYIKTLQKNAANEGKESVTIDSNNVYTALNSRFDKTVIVLTMKKLIRLDDRIIFEEPTSIVIQYFVR